MTTEPPSTASSGEVEAILETSVLFAMIVYGIVAIAIHGLITWLGGRIDRLDAEDREARRRRTVEDSTTVYREVTTRR